jgi:hypothetical protein
MMAPRPETAKWISLLSMFDSYNIKVFIIKRKTRWTKQPAMCIPPACNIIQEGILSRNHLSRKVYANWSGFLRFVQESSGGKNCLFFKKNRLTIYKRHQIVISELEIGAVGTDVSRRTPWRAREDLGRAEHGNQ